ncbi:MAG: hypothetical protein CVU11_04585 [Bacteroidetes bacterium HGW-Bacteroidetes-6]|nr:MAG: hypothetical protein CVU11_04585 [Bacteroidetes bacterium HGW-Bacteroidetes-6]
MLFAECFAQLSPVQYQSLVFRPNLPNENTRFFDPVLFHFNDQNNRTETFLYPLIIWSENNRFMPGVFVTNCIGLQHKFDYQMFPMYSSEFESMTGFGKMTLNNLLAGEKIDKSSMFVETKSYFLPDFNKASLRFYQWQAGFQLGTTRKTDSIETRILWGLKFHQNGTQTIVYENNGITYEPKRSYKILKAVRAEWKLERIKPERPFFVDIKGDFWNNFGRIYATYEYDNLYAKHRSFTFKALAGGFLYAKNSFINQFDARLNPASIGYQQDVFYDGWFLGRNPDGKFYNQQGLSGTGCMYTISPLGKTWDWTVAASTSISLPFDLPIRLYLSAGVVPDVLNSNKPFLMTEGGILIMPVKKYFEIAFPVFTDTRTQESIKLNTDNYLQRIRFIVNFDRIKLLKWPSGHNRKQE